ncbi:MAG: T9SS type A sorting domain-containing protein [Gracilimonas sp.]
MLFLFNYQNVSAQNISLQRTHAISDQQIKLNTNLDATGVLDVVAIMVEFQPDTNRLTSGTGIFGPDGMDGLPYLKNADDFRVEPLPHNRNYFEAHLEFAKNYYEKTSGNKLTINYQVLPDIYRLPKKMEEYSPIGETFTNEQIAELARDAWQQVENGSNFDATELDPETTAFVIFHAGVGRDIELTGTNLDITPYDIPSIYLRKSNLSTLLGEPRFDGFSVNDGTFRITNSLIIPRTESRRGLDIQDNEFVFPLSINGLLIASLGSHLGLPDLFNTETGDPGIGRFGLMDGAGFFTYNGLLPPEPSAWEKIYLGWQTPFLIDENTTDDIPLPASSLNQPNSIAKYELSESEYFLIENRHRDPNENGTTITIRRPDGSDVQQTFTNQDEAFVFQEADFDQLLEAGTFVEATNFDFSLPGGLDIGEDENDPADDRNLNGGILIWHIDEAVINAQLNSDRVNANPNRRGIDLEEADGAQDIGEPVAGALDNTAAFGTAFDFWWAGNDYRVILESGREISLYENRFGSDTQPNNYSNSGSPSFFELYDFSENLPEATFKIRPSEPFNDFYSSSINVQLNDNEQYFTLNDDYYDYFPLSLSIFETENDTFLLVPSQQTLKAINLSNPNTEQYVLQDSPVQQPFIGNDIIVLSNKPSSATATVTSMALSWNETNTKFDTLWTVSHERNRGFISSQNGDTLHADFSRDGILAADSSVVELRNTPFQQSERINEAQATAYENGHVTFTPNLPSGVYLSENITNRLYTGIIQLDSESFFYVFEDNKFALIDPEDPYPVVLFEEHAANWPAILDNADFLWVNRTANQIEGKNRKGGFLDDTPIAAPHGVQFTGTPLVMEFIDETTAYFVIGQDDYSLNIYAYDERGNKIEGFPLYVGKAENLAAQTVHPFIFNDELFAVSHQGMLKSWKLNNISDVKWSGRYGQAPFNKVSARVENDGDQNNSRFSILNDAETYNWPNPANENTNIRFEVASPGGTIDVSIITMSGRIIYEESIRTRGGRPEEININTQNWASGGYVARVKATVDGQTETKLIKIGVVH